MVISRLLLALSALAALLLPGATGAFGAATVPSGSSGGRLVAPGLADPKAIPDDAGGAVVAMRDPTTSSLVVNRFGPDGRLLWDQGLSFPHTGSAQLVSDGAGGAIVGTRPGEAGVMTVTRVLRSGAITWQATFPAGVLAGAGDGGAWVVSQSDELFADGITAAGELRARVQVTDSSEAESLPVAVGDGAGGVFLGWRYARSESQFGIAVQRLGADGALWDRPADVAGSSDDALAPSLVADGRGGVICFWHTAGLFWSAAYDSNGASRWERTLTLPASGAEIARVVPHASGGAFVAWTRRLRGEPLITDLLQVTFVGPSGDTWWTRDVTAVDNGVRALEASAADGGVVVGWQSAQLPVIGAAVDPDLYVSRITQDGSPTFDASERALATAIGPDAFGSIVPGPRGSVVAVFSQAPCLRAASSGVAMQVIEPDGSRAFRAEGSCP